MQILPSIKFVVDNSTYVSIDHDKIKEFASTITEDKLKPWANVPKGKTLEEKIGFLLVRDSVNFCFWPFPKWRSYGKETGSTGLNYALTKAMDKYPLTNPEFLSNMDFDVFNDIFQGTNEIPMGIQRILALREVGDAFKNKSYTSMLKDCDYDAMKLLNYIPRKMPGFHDKTKYKGKVIPFYKRAQLCISGIKNAGVELKNCDKLTAFADYRIPQGLYDAGVLKYSHELYTKIYFGQMILPGSEMETEIRANMIWAIELIKQELSQKIPGVTSTAVDDYCWLYAKNIKNPSNVHCTPTTNY
jgi:hypothetical protein